MAKTLNTVILEGYCAKDAVTVMVGEAKKCEFTLGVNHGKDKASFITVDAWNDLADIAGRIAYKGNHLIVRGELFIDTWKNNDKWNSKTHVKLSEIRLLETKKEDTSTANNENGEVEVSWLSEEDPF